MQVDNSPHEPRDDGGPVQPRPPRFSIILVHHDGSTPHEHLLRCVESLKAQTCQDFELLAYHNGPLSRPAEEMPVPFICSETNTGNWGYANRDRGIREATGDYIVHMNSDNVLYPNALEEISKAIDRPSRLSNGADTKAMIVFGIWAMGLQRYGDTLEKFPVETGYKLLLTGNPPKVLYIDAMQGVVRRELWLKDGGWYAEGDLADGVMLQNFAARYGYRSVEMVLGEHW